MASTRSLNGRVALVTGSNRGIGKAIALSLAGEGADVIINYPYDQMEAEALEVAEEIRSLGRRSSAIRANVAVRDEVEDIVRASLNRFGRIDILVNNAGVIRPAMLHEMTDQDWTDVIDVNLKGVFYCIRAIAPHMMEQQHGRIINITSVAGIVGTMGQVNYGASKAGVIGLTLCAARELAAYNVTVNAVAFGIVETGMTEVIRKTPKFRERYLDRILLGRFAKPEEVAGTVTFLASDDANYITGQVIRVDGGYGLR